LNWFKSGSAPPQQNPEHRLQGLLRAASTDPEDFMNDDPSSEERVPLVQQLLDNPFLLLFIGVMVPMVVYTLWGVIDILTVPLAK
jgi:hypothetical protein